MQGKTDYQQPLCGFGGVFSVDKLLKGVLITMEQDEIKNETPVTVVKPDEIESLPDLGFKDEGDLMIMETETGIIGVDKETGIVAVESDGASVEETAIVAELVDSGVAEVTTADEVDANTAIKEVESASDNGNSASNDDEE